jgi:heterodisulfide reductase subunit A
MGSELISSFKSQISSFNSLSNNTIGSVMVVGAGITGMQTALDLANSGYYVYLIEKTPSIGGVMSQLDKTFPTNDCAM